jgi:hypothetical protein
MPLDIQVKGDPAAVRSSGDWMKSMSTQAHGAGTQAYGARGESEGGWPSGAGGSFRNAMTQVGGGADDVSTGASTVADGLHAHADDLETVKARMNQAREVASAAGLGVTEAEIADPGPAPAAPGELPANAGPEQQQAHSAATSAQSAHDAKVRAYNEAQQTVTQARQIEQRSQSTLLTLLGGSPVGMGMKASSIAAGLTGVAIQRTSKFRGQAQSFGSKANRWAKLGESENLSPEQRANALVRKSIDNAKAEVATNKSLGTLPRRLADKIPTKAQFALTGETSSAFKMTTRVGKFAQPFLKKVPVIGIGLTAFGVGNDIANGKDPKMAIASGAGSLAAGAAVGAAVGGPVGVVAGAAVGAGVGYGIDHWDDVQHGVGEATDWAGDKLGDAGKAVGGLFD